MQLDLTVLLLKQKSETSRPLVGKWPSENKQTGDARSVFLIILLVLSALCVFSISFSALCSSNQNQSTSLSDDSMQLLN